MKPRFVLVDPSFTERDGDRWHYAVASAAAAQERGFDFVILSNRNAPSIRGVLPFEIDERRIFDYAFWEHARISGRHLKLAQTDADIRWNRRLTEDIGRIDKQIETVRSRGDIGSKLALESLQNMRMWSARLRGLIRRLRVRSTGVPRPFNRDQFAEALARALRSLALRKGDQVFCHMTTYGMLESLAEVTLALGSAAPIDATADFIFHFGADASDASTFLDRYGSYSAYGSIAERLAVGSPFRRMRFLATCPELQEEAERIIGAPVGRWHGLVDTQGLQRIFGSVEDIAALRSRMMEEFAAGRATIVVRAADLDAEKARAVSRACHLVQHRGRVVHLKLLHAKKSLPKLRDLLAAIDFPNLDLVPRITGPRNRA
jgi:hypothetical protein